MGGSEEGKGMKEERQAKRREEEGRREEGDGPLEEERGGWGERDREEQQRVGSKQEGGATGVGEQESRR